MAANPCSDGKCDSASKCLIRLRDYAGGIYEAEEWGVDGSLIDTNDWFQITTEFISKNDYTNLWKLRI